MKKTFRHYHQFNENEAKQLWKDALFVFDTNTLLNMYRYSRKTFSAYLKVLSDLKSKNQLWIPYQVGFEFYENRINVISEYEKSYDEILRIINQAKADIESRYKEHPFLNLTEIKEEMSSGLSKVETKINDAKKRHPKWMESDDVLEKLNDLFENNIGENYDDTHMMKVCGEGKDRYEAKIPPGFKDDKKPENKRYGDLIMWYQIIDKAKSSKKPIILISGDVKEDWWLEKDGKRIMPLPMLKKEMFDKAKVDFHIYTADRFLELYTSGSEPVDQSAIKEVRKIRELEEEKILAMRRKVEVLERELTQTRHQKNSEIIKYELSSVFVLLEMIILDVQELDVRSEFITPIFDHFYKIVQLRNRFVHDTVDRLTLSRMDTYLAEFRVLLLNLLESGTLNYKSTEKFRMHFEKLEYMISRMNKYF